MRAPNSTALRRVSPSVCHWRALCESRRRPGPLERRPDHERPRRSERTRSSAEKVSAQAISAALLTADPPGRIGRPAARSCACRYGLDLSSWLVLVSALEGAGAQRMTKTPTIHGMSGIEDLVNTIDGRIAHTQDEIRSLEAARSALTSDGSAATLKRVSPQRSGSRAGTSRRPASRAGHPQQPGEVVSAEQLEALLKSEDGLSTPQLAARADADRRQVLVLLRELEASDRVRRSGNRRATRWHAITDEDRIATRAAEIARQSQRRRARGVASKS